MSFNELSKSIHEANIKWWIDLDTGERLVRNKGELICLMHSELSEAFDGSRFALQDDHLPHRRMFDVELADTVIRLHDYAGGFGYDLEVPAAQNAVDVTTNTMMNLLLAHRALSQLMEAERKDNREAAEYWLAVANRTVRAFAIKMGVEIDDVVAEKVEYNRNRADHKLAARKAKGGKKW